MLIKLTFTPILLFSIFLSSAIPGSATTSVYFSAGNEATNAVIAALDSAKTDVKIETAMITDKPIQKAIIRAVKRGVSITMILDRTSHKNGQYTNADFFSDWNIKTFIYEMGAIYNNNLIVDSSMVLAGTFDFSGQTEKTIACHLMQIEDQPQIVNRFLENFSSHQKQSLELLPKRLRALMEEEQPPVTGEIEETASKPEKEKAEEKISYTGNLNSLTFHKSTCSSAKKLKEDNRIEKGSREEFITAGYKACGRCKP